MGIKSKLAYAQQKIRGVVDQVLIILDIEGKGVIGLGTTNTHVLNNQLCRAQG